MFIAIANQSSLVSLFRSRSIARHACRCSCVAPVRWPCLYMPCLPPRGAPGDFPPCIRQRPFFIEGLRQGFPVVGLCAPQRGCFARASSAFCMGLSFISSSHPVHPPLQAATCSEVRCTASSSVLHDLIIHSLLTIRVFTSAFVRIPFAAQTGFNQLLRASSPFITLRLIPQFFTLQAIVIYIVHNADRALKGRTTRC